MMSNTSSSSEFNYEKFFDEIVSIDPPSPPLLAPQDFIASDHDLNISVPEQGKSDHNLVGSSSSHPLMLQLHGEDQKEEKHPDDDQVITNQLLDGRRKKHASSDDHHHEEAAIVVVLDGDGDDDDDDDVDEKRMRKRASNREASKRARDKKQAQIAQLESQVNELKQNKSCLSKRLTDITHKYGGATEENMALKQRIEELRKLVNVGEEAFKAIILDSHQRFPNGGRNITTQTPPPPPPPVLAGDHYNGLQFHHQSSRDLGMNQLANAYIIEDQQPNHQQTIITTSTGFQGFLQSRPSTTTTPWDMSQVNFSSSSSSSSSWY